VLDRKFHVRTFGCQMNAHDSERIAGLLETDGMQHTDLEDDADVVVLNTCCIRENADDKLYGSLGWLKPWKEAREGRQIVVAGCLAQKDREIVRQKAPHVDVVMGTHNVHRTADLLRTARERGAVTEIFDEAVLDDHALFPSALPARRETSYNAWVTIQIGCDNTCAYCIVPAVRGKEISRSSDEIVDEVRMLALSGVTEVTLLGQNVNSYGRDLALAARKAGSTEMKLRPQFAELLSRVADVDGIRRVRYTSPHPKDMTLDVLQAMGAKANICEHLHYPLQSGSDRVLSLMEGTGAAEMTDRFVEASVAGERFDRMKAVLDRAAVRKHRARIGLLEEVVVEGRNKRNPDMFTGRTRQNKLVHFVADEQLRVGTFGMVEITDAARFHLSGVLREVTHLPTHRVRLPVQSAV